MIQGNGALISVSSPLSRRLQWGASSSLKSKLELTIMADTSTTREVR